MRALTSTPKPAWFRRLLPVAPPRPGSVDPAADPAQARERLAALMALDAALPEATRTRLVEPAGAAIATVVIWHGFTNAPSQFAAVAESLAELGYRVLLSRMPYHGLPTSPRPRW